MNIKILKYLLIYTIYILTCNSLLCAQNLYTIDSLKKVLQYSKEDSNKANTLFELCRQLSMTNATEALKYKTEILNTSGKISSPNIKARLHLILATSYELASIHDSALKYNQQGLFILEQKKIFNKTFGNLSNNIGAIYFNKGSYDSALLSFYRTLKIYENINDKIGIADSYYNIASIFYNKGSLDLAVEYYFISLRIYEKLHDNLKIAYCYVSISNIYYKIFDLKKAKEYSKLSLETALKLNDNLLLKRCLTNLAYIEIDQKNYDNAIHYLKQALEIAEKIGDIYSRASTLNDIGLSYSKKSEYDNSLNYFLRSLKVSEAGDYKALMAGTITNIGGIYFLLNKLDKSVIYNLRGLELTKILGDKQKQQQCLFNLFSTYEKQHNYEKALYFHKQYYILADSIFNETSYNKIAELETQYQTDKKVKEISILKKDNDLIQANLEKRNNLITFLLIGALLIIILIILLYNRKTLIQKNKHQQQMALSILNAQEQERQQIARDMHDGMGAFLSSLKLNLENLGTSIANDKKPVYTNAVNTVYKVTSEMRALAQNLVSDTLREYGLAIAVEELVETINQSGAIKVNLDIINLNDRLAIEMETAMFRMIQELLNNAIKHSQATNIDISIENKNNAASISVSDNGIGFNMQQVQSSQNGLGLKNLEARVSIMNGSFSVESLPGKGSHFHIDLPNKIA